MSHVHHHDDPTVSRGTLIAIGSLLAMVMAFTGAVQIGWLPQSANPSLSRAEANVQPAQNRLLRFVDRSDGAVVVSDAVSGAVVATIPYGEGGFLRATMRRMAKARLAKGIGARAPFELVRWENGALSIKDPQTGREAEIYGFGPDHTRMFAEMLEQPAP
jgi:putative photosynthetic complex assembly protein